MLDEVPKLLPPMWLAYLVDPSDSGKAYNDVRKRFDAGDEEAVAGMKMFADITERGRAAILAKDYVTLADLMDENFALPRTQHLAKTTCRWLRLRKSTTQAQVFWFSWRDCWRLQRPVQVWGVARRAAERRVRLRAVGHKPSPSPGAD